MTAHMPVPQEPGPDRDDAHPGENTPGNSPGPAPSLWPLAYQPVPPAGLAMAEPAKRRGRWWAPRRDVATGALVLAAMAVAGLLLGVVWYLIAPRLSFRIDASGNILPVGAVESEALIGADGWFVALTALVGLAAGLVCWWWLRAARGPAVAVGLAAGGVAGALVASWIGHLLGHGPSAAALRQVGNVVQAPLELRSKVALIVEPFLAVAVYVIGAGFAGEDDLGRSPGQPAPPPSFPPPDFPPPNLPPSGYPPR